MEDDPTRMPVLLVLLVAFVTGFFLREVSVLHRLGFQGDTNNVKGDTWLPTALSFFLLSFFSSLFFLSHICIKGVQSSQIHSFIDFFPPKGWRSRILEYNTEGLWCQMKVGGNCGK